MKKLTPQKTSFPSTLSNAVPDKVGYLKTNIPKKIIEDFGLKRGQVIYWSIQKLNDHEVIVIEGGR